MALKNGAGFTPSNFPVVVKGKATLLGTITANGDQLQFSLAPFSFEHSGSILIQVIGNGTITTLTADIQISLDGGTTFNAQTAAGSATVASNTAAINFQTGPLQSIALPGVGGEASLQFVVKSLAFGTATSAKVIALMA